MGKEVGDAEVYAKPHTMTGKSLPKAEFGTSPGFPPNRSKLETYDISLGNISKSAGNEPIKSDGIEMRGAGAATKGRISRGPMA